MKAYRTTPECESAAATTICQLESTTVTRTALRRETPAPKRILLVEDNALVRFHVATTLREAGYDVVETGTGAGALWAAWGKPADLVVTDIRLPDASGWRLAIVLRGRALPGVPMILLCWGQEDEAVICKPRLRGTRIVFMPAASATIQQAAAELLAA